MVLGPQVLLKWPNDLLVGEEKVGGILVEARGNAVVVGCGINIWWPDPPVGMTGLDDGPPTASRREEIAHSWAGRVLESALDPGGGWFSLDLYRRRCVTLGQRVSWSGGGAGRAVAIDPEGALVVEDDLGRTRLRSEEVFHVREAE
jgi:BirA family biotin operon repressor/biotin-[acetyl-CoA-carboxylase] ligase